MPTGARRKVDEELAELDAALASGDAAHADEELGDLLFAVVSWSRLLDRDPERLLRAANRKFEHRFRLMEAAARDRALVLDNAHARSVGRLWEAAKRASRGPDALPERIQGRFMAARLAFIPCHEEIRR